MNQCARRIAFFALIASFSILSNASPAYAQCGCQLPDLGTGTIVMPPDCPGGYDAFMNITTGIPDGSILIQANLNTFFGVNELPTGGGTRSYFYASLQLTMTGNGSLAGFARNIVLPMYGEIIWDPRTPGTPIQVFASEIELLEGSLSGDPDFDFIELLMGTQTAMDATGQTTLTRVGGPGTDFAVDSFFDAEYEINFVGAPGSVLAGMSGTTNAQTQFRVCGPTVSTQESSWGAIKQLYRN